MASSKEETKMRRVARGLLCGWVLALPFILPLDGCRSARDNRAVQTGPVKQYAVKGIIVGTDATHGEVTIDTEEIPGFMEAMTMPYKVKDPNVLQDLHPGDHMTGMLLVGANSTSLDQIVITSQAKPDYKPQAQYHVPAPGDRVPDFRLTNQNGRPITFQHFRGKALLVTFIYTRCPLSDYCPRMSRNFASIDKSLQADPALYRKTHLLSISFDPAYDSPAVLRSYGEAYTGNYTHEKFEHWDFAAPAKADLPKLLQFFDVGATPGEKGTITHSLSTAVIAPDGTIAQWYPTNDWNPADVLDELKKVAGGTKG
jgi:protein SCO1/2